MRLFLIVFIWEILTLTLIFSLTVEAEKTRVKITAVDDTIVFRFLRPRRDARLEGFILGYGSSMFSKQLIHLPADGQPFETEMDAEPRYMIALQPVASLEPKKKCTGRVNLEKPLNVVIGSVSDSSVLLSWGTLLQSPFQDSLLDHCFHDGVFTVRYREKEASSTWSYQTSPSSSTIIHQLKPHALYEFGVRADGVWSLPLLYSTTEQATREKVTRPNPVNPEKPALSPFLPPQPVLNINRTRAAAFLQQTTRPKPKNIIDSLPGRFSEVDKPEDAFQHCLALCVGASPDLLLSTQSFPSTLTSLTPDLHTTSTQTPPTSTPRPIQTTRQIPPSSLMENNPRTSREQVQLQRFRGRAIFRNSSSASRPLARNITQRLRTRIPANPPTKAFRSPLLNRNSSLDRRRVPLGERRTGIWASKAPKDPRKNQAIIKLNQVSETEEKDGVMDLKQMRHEPVLKPLVPPSRPSPTAPQTAFHGSRFNTGDNSSVFSPHPISEVDSLGKKRFTANHVIYKTDKRPEEPCSVTNSLSFFPDQEAGNLSVTSPPKTPPTNLTVLSVEGCPSFIILDWEESDNETTEYEVVSSTKGPHGEEVSILTTNQTHTAVENLKPESSYEFKVTPKNELGSGPASDPVNFSTESADPRVSETPTGRNAIWSSFPFKSDSYSECNGRQFVKRTWYRKFVGIQLCNSLRYKIYLSDSLKGKFYSIGDQTGYGEDHCQFVDSFLDGRTGGPVPPDQLPSRQGFFRAMRQEPVTFGEMGGSTRIHYVAWYECGIPIPGKW